MSVPELALAAFSISTVLGLATLLLIYPGAQTLPRGTQSPAWLASLNRRWIRPYDSSSRALSWRTRLLMGAGGALPVALLTAYAGFLWLLPVAVAAFGAAPEAYLAFLAARERARRQSQVPRALEALCRALRAGNNLYHSLERAAQEVGPPLGEDIQKALDHYAVSGDMAAALARMRQGANSPRLAGVLDVLVFDLEEGVAGTPGEVERLEGFLETWRQEDAMRRELTTRTAGTRFNLRLVSFIIPGTVLLVVATDSTLLTPLLTHPVGNLSLGLAVVAYVGAIYLSHRWSKVEL